MDGNRQHVDSNGNRVNVGNFDSNGLNVNNNWDDNRNSNIGVSSARKSSLYPRTGIPTSGGYSLYRSLVDLIQPPSIRPISSTNCCRVAYFLLSMVFTSFISRKNTRKKLSFTLVLSRAGSFSILYVWLAASIPSRISSMIFSHRCQMVYLSCFVTESRYP